MRPYLKNNESGFTLLEALIAVMLSSLIMLFLCTGIRQLSTINELIVMEAQTVPSSKLRIKGNRQVEWHIFLNQFERFLENTTFVRATARSLVVKENNTEVEYRQARTGTRNFCRSKHNGYDAMLTEIKQFHIEVEGQWLLLHFTFQNNQEYKGRIWVESWGKENNSKNN